MKKLASYLKRYTKESILAPLFKLLEVVFDLMVPLVVARMINIGVAGNDRGYMVRCFLILVLMALLGLAASITAQFFAAKASTGFAADLRQAVFDHIQGFSFTELDTLGADTMITRLTDDINQVQTGVNMGLRLLLRSPFVVFGAMIMAFTIDVSCAWVFAVVIPVLFVAVFAIMLSSIPLYRKAQSALDRVTCLTRENLTGVRVIRAFCREDHSVREFDESSQCYKIPVTGTVGYYRAVVTRLFKRSGQLHVTVGYIPTSSTDDSIINQSSDTPTKYMDYLFQRQSGSWYLTGLTESETKPDSTASTEAASQPQPMAESDVQDAILATAGSSEAASDAASDAAAEPDTQSLDEPAADSTAAEADAADNGASSTAA